MADGSYSEARDEVADAMAQTAELYGLNRSYGRIYGYLYIAGEPKSLDELADESGYAKSTVSNAMSKLERYHLVRRRSGPGEGRRVYFEAESDFWTVLSELLEQQGQREVRIMQRALAQAEVSLEGSQTMETRRAEERLAQLKRFYDQLELVLEAFTALPIEQVLSFAEDARNDREDRFPDRDT